MQTEHARWRDIGFYPYDNGSLIIIPCYGHGDAGAWSTDVAYSLQDCPLGCLVKADLTVGIDSSIDFCSGWIRNYKTRAPSCPSESGKL